MLIFSYLLLRNGDDPGGEAIVDVVDLPGGDRHIPGGFDRRAVVIDRSRPADRGAVIPQRAANQQIAAAVDQPMIAVVQGLYPEVDALAPGKGRRRAVFRQVVEGDGIDANGVAVDAAAAAVGEGSGVNSRIAAVDQPGVEQRVADVKRVLPGVNFAAGAVAQAAAGEVEPAACQQPAAVGDIPRGGEREAAVGHHRPAVIQRPAAAQSHIAERQQLTAAVEAIRIDAQHLAGFHGAALVQQRQPVAANIYRPGGRQPAAAVIELAAVAHHQRFIGQDHPAVVIERLGGEGDVLRLQPLIVAEGVVVDKPGGGER